MPTHGMTIDELKEYGEQRVIRMDTYGPIDRNCRIWRFIDLAKFISLLERRSLYFARADTLDDPFEGSYGHGNIGLPDEQRQKLERYFTTLRQHFYVNCWHINEFESAAMWKLYASHEYSIAIQSTWPRIRGVLPHRLDKYGFPKRGHIDIGKVRYMDYAHERIWEGFTFDAFLHKRKSFEHEQELRAFFSDPDFPDIPRWYWLVSGSNGWSIDPELSKLNLNLAPGPMGIYIPINLKALITRISISPEAPDWFQPLVTSVCARFKLDVPIEKSELHGAPLY